MKWYSVKKYHPPSCSNVFIRTIRIKNNDYVYGHFVAMIEDFTGIEQLENWKMANEEVLIIIDPTSYRVTHFCIPDPIELEE